MIRKLAVFISIFIVCSIAFLPVKSAAVTVTIQPPSRDSFIDGYNFATNYGSIEYLIVAYWLMKPVRTLVKFDLSSIPSGSTVSSATLKLYYYQWTYYLYGKLVVSDPAGRTYRAYRITQSWTEGGVTWDKYDGVNSWATAGGGGDYTTTGGASATVPSSYGWMNWIVTDIVKAWVEGGAPNNGFLIKDSTEWATVYFISWFCSREVAVEELRPILEVTYTPPGPIPELSLPLVTVVSTAAIILFLYKRKLSPNLTH